MSPSPPLVEVRLLYSRPVTLMFEALLGELNAAFADRGVALAKRPESCDGLGVYASSDLHVRIHSVASPAAPELFRPALAAAGTSAPDFRPAVLGHTATVTISVGAGPFSLAQPQALYGEVAPFSETQDGLDNRLLIARALADSIAARHRPLAIHWPMTNRLLSVDDLRAVRDEPFPLSLFVAPEYFSSGQTDQGLTPMGFHALGSELLIGKRIVFTETPLPPAHLMRRTLEFIAYCRARGEIIPDGDSFGASEADVIRVRHIPPAGDRPEGRVELTYERVGPEVLEQTSLSEQAMYRLREVRRTLTEVVPQKKPRLVTYSLCAVALAATPVIGLALLLLNLFFGPRLKPTALAALAAVLIAASGLGVSIWFAGWQDIIAALERARS